MPARRTSSRTGELAHQRLRGDLEELIGVLGDRLDARLSRIEHDIAEGQLDRNALRSDINETRRDVGELRDAITMRVKPATRAAISDAVKSPWGRVVAFCVGFVAIVSALSVVPKAMGVVEDLWVYIRDADQ